MICCDMNTLENQVAVVTGASSGIGRAIAIALAAQGASLCLVGRKLDTLQSVAGAPEHKPSRHRCYQADLAVERQVDELIAAIKRDTQSVDILVHSAGVIWLGPHETATAGELDDHYKINVRAPYLLTQGLLPALKAAQGQIVFVNSSAGLLAKANAGQYAASKHGLKAIADSLREEVNPAGVRILSLFLGRTASPMQASVHAMEGKAYHPELLMQPEDVAAVTLHALTLPRSVEVTDISMRSRLKSY
jgi:NADP-dependent 3-hydroxy acid dehydrogenase YdfG